MFAITLHIGISNVFYYPLSTGNEQFSIEVCVKKDKVFNFDMKPHRMHEQYKKPIYQKIVW